MLSRPGYTISLPCVFKYYNITSYNLTSSQPPVIKFNPQITLTTSYHNHHHTSYHQLPHPLHLVGRMSKRPPENGAAIDLPPVTGRKRRLDMGPGNTLKP